MGHAVDAKVMLHPHVLELFEAEAGLPIFGLTDVRFPNMSKACQWLQIWADESGTQPDVSLMSHGCTLFRPVVLTVRGG